MAEPLTIAGILAATGAGVFNHVSQAAGPIRPQQPVIACTRLAAAALAAWLTVLPKLSGPERDDVLGVEPKDPSMRMA